ncbi:hypothetical protein [Shewanella nanhaiensis]|uniref:Uncharacterized protein n=1 Tax=Shewanella nanhaiensis TaxID=2864872 RepID=A0ABS7DXJ1_9GAMM|nr:hypothetical protein [Shewanella nanhaiensis]MBW8182150.1 hypothetical protein [Shewanella nanhaiensis]
MSSFNAEVGSQKHSLQASFSGADAVTFYKQRGSLTLVSLCSSLVANHMDVVNVINAGAIKDLASAPLNSR